MSVLQGLSGVRLRPAAATVGSEYANHCAGYDNWTGYNNNTLACVGAPYSYIYCGTDGWFKNGYFNNSTTFYSPLKICGTGVYSARNAWRWSYGANRFRCADGNYWYKSSGVWRGPFLRICSQWVGSA